MRIASLLSAATEIVCQLGLADQLVGISHECDYPSDVLDRPRLTRSLIDDTQSSAAIDEQVRTKLQRGEPLYEIDAERLVALQPDIIITQAQCEVCAISEKDLQAVVANHDALSTATTVTLDPRGLADVFRDINRVGAACDCTAKADDLVSTLQARLQVLTAGEDSAAVSSRPRVLCIEWTDPLMAAANWMPEIVAAAGGINLLSTPGSHSGVIEWDAACSADPDVILVMPCGFNLERAAASVADLSHRPGWVQLKAVQRQQVFACDGNALFNRSGPRLVDTAELIAGLIHPRHQDLRERHAAYWRLVV